MSVKETISRVVDKWFLYEPLLFNVYCTHKLEANSDMKCTFRTGKRRHSRNSAGFSDQFRKSGAGIIIPVIHKNILRSVIRKQRTVCFVLPGAAWFYRQFRL